MAQLLPKGGWAVAQSPILVTAVALERLKKRGYEAMLDYYFKVSPQLNEPLYTRPVPMHWNVVGEAHLIAYKR